MGASTVKEESEVVDEFLQLVRIPSPSGKEAAVAKHIQGYLSRLGIRTVVDNAGSMVGSNTGNVIAKIGDGNPRVMLVAHIDTVEDGKRTIRPVIRNGVIYSDGTTILGSDDKGGVAALLAAVKELKGKKTVPPYLCAFAISEEKGIMGVKFLKVPKNIDFVFDVDGSEPPGTFLNKALGHLEFEFQIHGIEAHAAKDPENGRNALKAAALIISKLKLGRLSNGRTQNIGTIQGGRANNIIPAYATFTGGVRAYKKEEMEKMLKDIENVVKGVCNSMGCSYKLIRKTLDPPLNTSSAESIVLLAKKAAKVAGLPFSVTTLSATTQGGQLAEKGYTVLGICRGGTLPHSKDEHIAIDDLVKTKRLLVGVIMNAMEV